MHRSLGRQWLASHAEGRLSPWLELTRVLLGKKEQQAQDGWDSFRLEKLWLNVSFQEGGPFVDFVGGIIVSKFSRKPTKRPDRVYFTIPPNRVSNGTPNSSFRSVN